MDVGGVGRVLHEDVTVGEQDRVEVEAGEAAEVHRRDPQAVAGHPDEAHQTLLTGFDQGFERPARPHRHLPLIRLGQVVELDQVDLVDLQPLQRAAQFVARPLIRAVAGFGRQEEVPAMAGHPGADAQLGVAVAGGGVDMVDAVLEQDLQRAVSVRLADSTQRRRAKERPRAQLARTAKGLFSDHR